MKTNADRKNENASQNFAGKAKTEEKVNPASHFVNQSQEVVAQRKLQYLANNYSEATQFKPLQNPGQLMQQKARGTVVQRQDVWEEVDVGFGSKPTLSPEEYADSLTSESEEFEELRGKANEQINTHHGTDLNYKPKPKKGGGGSEAYFKDDSTYFNMEGHPAMILSNIIFETANAAQAGQFLQVEADYKSGEIMDKTPKDYGYTDLGKKLLQEYQEGDGETRRAIIQERFEWNSFILAKPTFLKVKKEMVKNKKSKEMYETFFAAFDHMLEMESFEEYYAEYGHMHRNAVEGVLRKVAEQEREKSKSNCYITTACTEAKGLPDDCEELTVLRRFRDKYLMSRENGSRLVEAYYKHAPQIVSAIRRREDEEQILARLYGIITQCVEAIKGGNEEFAYVTYCKMVVELKNEYIPEPGQPAALAC